MSAVPLAVDEIEALLEEGSLLELGARVGSPRLFTRAGYREDGAVLLADQGRIWNPVPGGGIPRELHLLEPTESRVRDLKALHPGLWIHAGWPGAGDLPDLERLVRVGVESFSIHCGPSGSGEDPRWDLLEPGAPLVICATYGPTSTPRELARRLEGFRTVRALKCLAWLPESPGEGVHRAEATDGLLDARLLAVSRLVLPAGVRVRASWAAFGWKMAQFLLACGADEVAGWGLEEERAWGGALALPCPVGAREARAGVAEASRQPVEVRGCAWES